MEKKEEKIFIPNVDDSLFKSGKSKDIIGNVRTLSIKDIDNFPQHPFRVIVEEEDAILESIKSLGVKTPILVRPKGNDRYEIISGHRRKKASEMLGLETIPCIVQELTDDEATILMVDSNFQREKILPSERAFAYKLKIEALKHQGQRNDLTNAPLEQKSDKTARDIVANESGESREQVRRYIRLTELIPELLNMVDNEQIAFRPAVEISYLTKEEQVSLLDLMQCYDCTPSLAQAIKLKKESQKHTLTTDYMEDLLGEEKPNQKPKISVSAERLVLPDNLRTIEEQENYVVNAVETYSKYQVILPQNLTTDEARLNFMEKVVKFYNNYQQRKREREQER